MMKIMKTMKNMEKWSFSRPGYGPSFQNTSENGQKTRSLEWYTIFRIFGQNHWVPTYVKP